MTDQPTWRTIDMPSCYRCGKQIGRNSETVVVAPNTVRHSGNSRCPQPPDGDSRPEHKLIFPDCPVSWHDMWDHRSVTFLRGVLPKVLADGGWDAVNSLLASCSGYVAWRPKPARRTR